MEKITLLARQLKNSASHTAHLQHLTFQTGEMFHWSHTACAITYNPRATNAEQYLLHEFGHALLNHSDYPTDIDLVKMERDAWEEALKFAKQYKIPLTDEIIENAIDSYRDWLHSRSLCPTCNATGIQSGPKEYSCLSCHTKWHVNEARSCQLRRTIHK